MAILRSLEGSSANRLNVPCPHTLKLVGPITLHVRTGRLAGTSNKQTLSSLLDITHHLAFSLFLDSTLDSAICQLGHISRPSHTSSLVSSQSYSDIPSTQLSACSGNEEVPHSPQTSLRSQLVAKHRPQLSYQLAQETAID